MKPAVPNHQTRSIALAIAVVAMSASVAVHAQVIDPLNGTSAVTYTPYLILDNSDGTGGGITWSESTGSLVGTSVGPSDPEQSLYLANASSFSTVFAVGDTLSVAVSVPANTVAEDIGLAITGSNPSVAGSGNGYSSRTSFDYATISVRPSQTSIRQNTSVLGAGGQPVTGNDVIAGVNPTTVTGLYITWVSPLTFNLGYLTAAGAVQDDTFTFESGSTIGTEIGLYTDVRTTGDSLGALSNLTISTPEPSTLALCGLGIVGMFGARKLRKVRKRLFALITLFRPGPEQPFHL
jgi:hypothetical protein